MYSARKFIFILLFIICGSASIFGQDRDYHEFFGDVSEALSRRYKKGFDIVDCDERRDHWRAMWAWMDKVELSSSLVSATYFFGDAMSDASISDLGDLNTDTTAKIDVLEYCSGSGYGMSICAMCTDAWRSIVENYINQVYIFFEFLDGDIEDFDINVL